MTRLETHPLGEPIVGKLSRLHTGRPAEMTALGAGGIGAVVLGLGVEPGLAAAIALGVGMVPGLVTGLINAGGISGAVRLLWRGRSA